MTISIFVKTERKHCSLNEGVYMLLRSVTANITLTFAGFKASVKEFPEIVVVEKNIPEAKAAISHALHKYLSASKAEDATVEINYVVKLNGI